MTLNYFRKVEKSGLTYSIDFFSFEFSLRLSSAQWEELEAAVKALGEKATSCRFYSGSKKKGRYHKYRAYEIERLHVQFYEDAPVLQLDYNPNTVHSAEGSTMLYTLDFLLGYIRRTAALSDVRVKRIDYAVDVPCKYTDLYVYSRKSESHVRSTRYYGLPTLSGRLRLYDKRAEQKEKYKLDLGRDLTRCEWIQRNEKPFTFDCIGKLNLEGFSGAVSLLEFVPVEYFNEAMQRLSKSTRKKIADRMEKIPIDPSVFNGLLNQYYDDYSMGELRMAALLCRADDAGFKFSDDDDE